MEYATNGYWPTKAMKVMIAYYGHLRAALLGMGSLLLRAATIALIDLCASLFMVRHLRLSITPPIRAETDVA